MIRKLISASWSCALTLAAAPLWCADSGATPTLVADASSSTTVQADVTAVFSRFVSAQNRHDPSALSEVLLESQEFVWAQGGGRSIWGFDAAMAAWKSAWKGSWHLDPQLKELRIVHMRFREDRERLAHFIISCYAVS